MTDRHPAASCGILRSQAALLCQQSDTVARIPAPYRDAGSDGRWRLPDVATLSRTDRAVRLASRFVIFGVRFAMVQRRQTFLECRPCTSRTDLSMNADPGMPKLSVGVDLVHIPRVEASLRDFGERFVQRLFTPDEAAYATGQPASQAERLAARFAAKEAAIKAFEWSEAGVNWRDVEVVRLGSGACRLVLHGRARELADAQDVTSMAVSLSHDGDYATAVVTVLRAGS